MGKKLTVAYIAFVSAISVCSLIYVYAFPPASMKVNRDGIAHFTPAVINPETGEAVSMTDLARHFRGD